MTDLEVVVDIQGRTPGEVRRWWTETPSDYRASDPKEQPHRIVTVAKHADGAELDTYWRTPFGEQKMRESLRFLADGRWAYDLVMMGNLVHDEMTATATPEGSRLVVRSTFTPVGLKGKVLRPMLLAFARRSFPANWRHAGTLCERAAPTVGALS